MLYDSLWYQDNLIFVTQTFFIVLKKSKKKENGFYFQSKHIWWSGEFFFLSVSLSLNVVKKMVWIMPTILSISIAKSTSFLENKWKSMSRNLLSMRRQLNSFSQSHDNLGHFSHVARILHYDVRKKIWPVWTHDVSEKNFSSLLFLMSFLRFSFQWIERTCPVYKQNWRRERKRQSVIIFRFCEWIDVCYCPMA
jgi:hypothetical protein